MYTVRTLIFIWFINECVITFLAISQCRVVKKWGGQGPPGPHGPPGSDAFDTHTHTHTQEIVYLLLAIILKDNFLSYHSVESRDATAAYPLLSTACRLHRGLYSSS